MPSGLKPITVDQAIAEGWYRPNTTGGLCECGCGHSAPISPTSRRRQGVVRGQPCRFIPGHNRALQAPLSQDARRRIADAARGRRHTEETRQKLSASKMGTKNPMFGRRVSGLQKPKGSDSPLWKGDAVGYSGVHRWLYRTFPRTRICEECGVVGDTHWANISGQYRRDRADYRELCPKCHWAFDRIGQKLWATRRQRAQPSA